MDQSLNPEMANRLKRRFDWCKENSSRFDKNKDSSFDINEYIAITLEYLLFLL